MNNVSFLKYWKQLCFVSLLVIWPVWSGCQAEESVKIGFLGGTSGRVADLGTTGQNAAQLAVEQCNQSGGISGRKVQLIIRDDQQIPEVAQQAVRDLIAQGVTAIIGPMTSDMAVAVVPTANEARVPLVSPTATTEALTGLDDYFFRVTSTTGAYASLSAAYNIKSGDMRNVAAAYDLNNRSFTENWLENFRKPFTDQGGRILAAIGFRAEGPATFTEIAAQLLAARPDGVLIVANSMDSALLCQQIRKIDSQIKITLADWGATERLLELGGRAVEGVTVVQTFDRDNQSPRYQDYRRQFIKRYQQEPGFPGVHTYEAVQVLVTALRARNSGQTVKEALLAGSPYQGLQDEFSLDRFGDAKRPQASISVVRDQAFVVVE